MQSPLTALTPAATLFDRPMDNTAELQTQGVELTKGSSRNPSPCLDVIPRLDPVTAARITDDEWLALWAPSSDMALLNHGAYGRPYLAVRDAQAAFNRWLDSDPARFYRRDHDMLVASAAECVASWLGVPATHGTAFVHNASTAVVDAVASFTAPADTVLLTDLGYGGVRLGVRDLASRRQVRVHTASFASLNRTADYASIILDKIAAIRPAVVVLDQVTSTTGLLFPVADIIAAIKAASPQTRIVVDAAHAAGMLRTPFVPGADAWVTNLHKWVSAAQGAAVVVARKGERLAPASGSWSVREIFPHSYTWVGTDGKSAWMTAPLAVEITAALLVAGLDTHIRSTIDFAAAMLAAAWDVPRDPRPPGLSAPWLGLLEVPTRRTLHPDTVDAAMLRARRELRADVALTSFADKTYLRMSAHGYTRASEYERLTRLPALLNALS